MDLLTCWTSRMYMRGLQDAGGFDVRRLRHAVELRQRSGGGLTASQTAGPARDERFAFRWAGRR
eukprot:5392214-Alexandrium_andersonii.AAC.1